MANTVISYPIPPYSNVPIEPQYYKPNNFIISAITLGWNTLVTTSVDNNFVIGQLVRFFIPFACGSRQLNNQTGYVIDTPASNQVLVNLNSTNADAFQTVATGTQPQIIPVGDVNNGYTSTTGINNNPPIIPGSFINISPN
jgi:hypothetical protein